MAMQSMSTTRVSASGWLRRHPEIGEAARMRVDVPGKALPDAVLEDPAHLVTMLEEAAARAVREAPPGVAEELLASLRVLAARVERFDRSGYAARQLHDLQGLRDRDEITGALRRTRALAPDAERAPIDRLLRIAEAVSTSDPVFLGPNDTGSGIPVDPGGGSGPIDSGPPAVNLGGGTDLGGTTDPGAGSGGTDSGATSGADLTAFGGSIGADVAAQMGISTDTGTALGQQLAGQLGGGGGASGGGLAGLGGLIGAAVGAALGGPAGAAIGFTIGNRIGAVLDGSVGTGDEIDATTLAACLLCGPECIICMLTAETIR